MRLYFEKFSHINASHNFKMHCFLFNELIFALSFYVPDLTQDKTTISIFNVEKFECKDTVLAFESLFGKKIKHIVIEGTGYFMGIEIVGHLGAFLNNCTQLIHQ